MGFNSAFKVLKQTWKAVGFVRDVEGEMSQAKTALALSLTVTECHIDLTNRRQDFACHELGRLLGRKKCEELEKNMRNQAKRKAKKYMWKNKGENCVIFVSSVHKQCKIQQKDARTTPWV
jgi:sulfate adenylyltransferase subunit 1 (EFTu-like GTPase family)